MLAWDGLRIWALTDGRFALDGGAMFGIVPKPLWSRRIGADDQNRIPMALRCLLLQTGDRLILVDTGIGSRWSQKETAIYAIDHREQDLVRSLKAAGFAPEDVTDVVLTHLHFDHAGGALRTGADGDLGLTFGRARHHLQRRHLAWAQAASDKDRGSFRGEDIARLMDSGQVRLRDGGGELAPGIELVVCEGHTVAQQVVRASDGSRTLLYCGDVVPTAAHLRLPWIMGYDLQPLATLEEKRSLLTRAAADDWLLVFEHDPVVAACRVRSEGGQFVPSAPVEI
ncbi:MAG: MBL fold metallo-hydrolase [Deltaproteobacteria bacterium]|nr:MBL fold metallo-hydrolase [Deltaproteobacteria bacterium]